MVVQGTDTLEESAYLLDLLWDRPEPVVLTGAMRNPTLAGADGPANLLAAVSVAADPEFRDLGALVVLADEVHSARSVKKAHTTRPHAFASPDGGPLGVVVEGRPRLLQRPGHARGHPQTDRAAVRAGAGADRRARRGPVGGRAPWPASPTGSWWPRSEAATSPGASSSHWAQSPSGCRSSWPAGSAPGRVLTSTYRAPGSETDLLGRGLIWSGFLGAAKSRVLLVAALACDTDRAWLSETFAQTG